MPTEPLLDVKNLVTGFQTQEGFLRAVDGLSFSVDKGKTLGIVGESGCGKSVSAMSLIDLLPKPAGRVLEGDILFKGKQLRGVDSKVLQEVRGGEIGVIFQEPMTALNPVQRIGKQMIEGIIRHQKVSKREALEQSVNLLKRVGIPNPEMRVSSYPHQLSGGMRQRVMIAMAISCKPDLLIADEPTTALDVTVQSQILSLLEELQEEYGMAIIMITHDLGVIAETCDDVVVMYGGRIVEKSSVLDLFTHPQHAYTKGLLNSLPKLDGIPKTILSTIPGQVASLKDYVSGCRFCQRMERTGKVLEERPPFEMVDDNHWVEKCDICIS